MNVKLASSRSTGWDGLGSDTRADRVLSRYAAHFGCRRIIHLDDRDRSTSPTAFAEDLLMIPVPGHTKGSVCVLHSDRHLFTGDHLAWDRSRQQLTAFRDVCWYDWGEQVVSMERLAAYRFEWVLPGHGAPCHLPAVEMSTAMRQLLAGLRARG